MSSLKSLIIVIKLCTIVYSQGIMNGYGIGSVFENQGSISGSNGLAKLSSSFMNNVSISNPSTWNNLDYTYLSVSYSFDEALLKNPSNLNGYSSLSNISWIIPVKSKSSFGLSLAPYSDQRIDVLSDSSITFIAFGDTLESTKQIKRVGGIVSFKLGGSRVLNSKITIGTMFNFLFGSSRVSESIKITPSSPVIQKSRQRYSGLLSEAFLNFKINEKNKFYVSYLISLNPLRVANRNKPLFDDVNKNEYYDYFSPLYDFPHPDSLTYPSEERLNDVHSPSSYHLAYEHKLNNRSVFSIEMGSYSDDYKANTIIQIPLNKTISSVNTQKILFTRFSDKLSLSMIDKVTMRFGFQNKQGTLEKDKENKIREIGISAGLGFRFKKIGNQIDFNYYYGLRDYENINRKEYFQQVQLSTSLADLWFVKRRQK